MKRYISAILVPCFLLQLFGCYSMEPLTKNYKNGDDINKIFLTSKSGENYTFEKFNSINQVVREPKRLFFTDYSFQDSNFIIIGNRFNTEELNKGKKLLQIDTLIYNVNELLSIDCKQYNSGNTGLLIGVILAVGLIAVVTVIVIKNNTWTFPSHFNFSY